MTAACPDADALLALEHALAWDASARLDHLARCGACRTALEELELVRGSVAWTAPDPALTARILASLSEQRAAERAGHRGGVRATADAPPTETPVGRTPPRRAPASRVRATLVFARVFALATACAWSALGFARAASPDAATRRLADPLPLALLGGVVAAARAVRAAPSRGPALA